MRSTIEIQADIDAVRAEEHADRRNTRGPDGKPAHDAEQIRHERLRMKEKRRAYEDELAAAHDAARPTPRSVAVVEAELHEANQAARALKVRRTELARELNAAHLVARVSVMTPEQKAALAKALRDGQTIAPTGIQSAEKFGTLGAGATKG
jgi:hypothetical protein